VKQIKETQGHGGACACACALCGPESLLNSERGGAAGGCRDVEIGCGVGHACVW